MTTTTEAPLLGSIIPCAVEHLKRSHVPVSAQEREALIVSASTIPLVKAREAQTRRPTCELSRSRSP
jgi:hypothetical protein